MVSDKWYAGVTGAKYVPLGSHPGLVQSEAPSPERFDVTLLAYVHGRRDHLAHLLSDKGISSAPSRWNPERDSLLKSTAAMLHIHQWENIHTIAPLRFAIAAAYGLPLISERVEDRSILDGVALFSTYDAMPDYVTALIRRYPEKLREHGDALKELLTGQYSFRNCVERAL